MKIKLTAYIDTDSLDEMDLDEGDDTGLSAEGHLRLTMNLTNWLEDIEYTKE